MYLLMIKKRLISYHKYLDDINQETTVSPKMIARKLMEADKGLFITVEVSGFLFFH